MSILCLALVMAACAPVADAPPRIIEERTGNADAPRGPALLRRAMLAAHNRVRAEVGVPPLVWDETLASHAAAYAQTLADAHRFEHAHQPAGPGREGENLWTGTRGAYRYDEMIGGMIDERRYFRNLPTPSFSTTGRWQDAAHYTQMIWRGTARVGCAIASNEADDYLVCRYSPPGNVWGAAAF